MDRRVHRSARWPVRCPAVTPLPWRSPLAVVLSVAAIAGCGQASDASPAVAGMPTGATTPVPGTATQLATTGGSSPSAAQATPDGGTASEPRDAGESGSDGPPRSADGPRDAGSDADPEQRATPAPHTAASDPADLSTPPAADQDDPGSDTGGAPDVELDPREHTVVALLDAARQAAGVPQLQIDATLVESARDHACAMAQGSAPLVSEGDTENVGLVVEPQPAAAARAMHDWWMQSDDPRRVRMAETFTRYGVGACAADDRIFYAERFAS